MLAFLTLAARAAILGIDIGSEAVRASVLRPGNQIEVLLTSDSKRTFPVTLTVVPKQVPIPEQMAYTEIDDFDFMANDPLSMKKYPNSTIHHWSNFVAKMYNESVLEVAQERKLYATASKMDDGRLLLAGLLPEVLFYRVLDTVNVSMKHLDENSVVTSTVITVPKFWPQAARDVVRAIARIRKFNPYVIDSSRAYATMFAMEQKQHFQDVVLNVAFCDIGASNVQVVVTEFKKKPRTVVKEVAYAFSEKVGGRDFDVVLYNLMTANFQGKITARGEQQILIEANKVKHRLTTDTEVVGVVEQVDGSNDLHYHVTREQFEAAAAPLLEAIRATIKSVGNVKVDRVQILGGGSRVPCVQKAVSEAFGIDKLMFSMNAEEANAIGAAYYGATLSSDYMMPKVLYQSLELYPASIQDVNGTYYEIAKHSPIPGEEQCIVNNVTDNNL